MNRWIFETKKWQKTRIKIYVSNMLNSQLRRDNELHRLHLYTIVTCQYTISNDINIEWITTEMYISSCVCVSDWLKSDINVWISFTFIDLHKNEHERVIDPATQLLEISHQWRLIAIVPECKQTFLFIICLEIVLALWLLAIVYNKCCFQQMNNN